MSHLSLNVGRRLGAATLVVLAAGPVLALSAVPARAREAAEPETRMVSTRGADLATLPGQAEMGRRIERAARRVCGSDDVERLGDRDAYETCHRKAVTGAWQQLQVLIAAATDRGATRLATAAAPGR